MAALSRDEQSTEAIAERLMLTWRAYEELQGLQLSARQFAKMMGFSEQVWNHYVKARQRVSLNHALRIKRKTGVTLDWIYDGDTMALPAHVAAKIHELTQAARRKKRA